MIGNCPSDFVRLFIRQFLWTVWRWIIRFREPVYSRHLPSAKSRKGCLWGKGRLYTGWSQTDNPFLALMWKRPITKSDPVSSVFNDSNGQYRATVCRWLVRRPHYSARLKRFGSRGPSVFFFFFQIRYRNTLTEKAWEDAIQGLGMAMSTEASEKNKELLFIGNVFYKQWHLRVLFHKYFKSTTSWKSQILIPRKKADFRYAKN